MAEDILKGIQINSKGYGTISKIAMQDRNLHITAKAIYAYFNSFSGGGDSCFPTRAKICYDLGISNDTFGKYLKQLVNNGYIEVEQVKENGRFSHNVYTICSTILPCPKISDTVNIVYGEMDTNNNSYNKNKDNNNNKDNNIKEKYIKEKPVKHKYGEYNNVLLTDAEFEKLKAEFPNDYQSRIEELSGYMQSKGARYKDHLATIRNWARRKQNNGYSKPSYSQQNYSQPAQPKREETEEERQQRVHEQYLRAMEAFGVDPNEKFDDDF